MGGGDLNLKKSWHPTTLRNMERVWKAEQKHEAEQKKIEELQKELANEKAREEIREFAENQGVLQKKSSRLDWMYEGAGSLINREEYLLGKTVDKTIEQNEFGIGKSELETIPESICRSSGGNVTVDLANKIREDPMLTIKQQEEDSRKQLLNNPIRIKQIQELLRQSSGSKKVKKSKKKKKKSRSESSDDDSSPRSSRHRERNRSSSKKNHKHSHKDSKRDSSSKNRNSSLRRSRSPRERREFETKNRRRSPRKSPPRVHVQQKSTKKLNDDERDRKLREMMENAKWRDDQRSQRINRHIHELKQEVELQNKNADVDFITPMLNQVASTESVSGRIKRNMYNIQRTRADLDKSFVKR